MACFVQKSIKGLSFNLVCSWSQGAQIRENIQNNLYIAITPIGKLNHSVEGYRNASCLPLLLLEKITEPRKSPKVVPNIQPSINKYIMPQSLLRIIPYDDTSSIRILKPTQNCVQCGGVYKNTGHGVFLQSASLPNQKTNQTCI